jgi:hypothetical protein
MRTIGEVKWSRMWEREREVGNAVVRKVRMPCSVHELILESQMAEVRDTGEAGKKPRTE